jgi:hypothetical protein
MFIQIMWKNSKGEAMKTLVEAEKVQGFINEFEKRQVEPALEMPEDVTLYTKLEGLPLQN